MNDAWFTIPIPKGRAFVIVVTRYPWEGKPRKEKKAIKKDCDRKGLRYAKGVVLWPRPSYQATGEELVSFLKTPWTVRAS